MKKSTRIEVIVLAALIIAGLSYYFLFKHIISEPIKQEISANVYVNGDVTEQTTIKIDGERVYSFISEYRTELLNFYGTFGIECYERTYRDGAEAHIYGERYVDTQTIMYYQAATPSTFELNSRLLINRDMNEIAIGFEDGTVIATSDELYQAYISEMQPQKD